MRHFKKTISLLLCAMLLIAMIPMAAITTQAADTITVYFTDNADFGTPNVHYWGDGETAWPGNAMTYSETNDFGQNVYKATVPANVTGIIFNGNNKQTVDITSGIANNVQWYTDGTQDGKYKVVAIQHESTEPVQPTSAPVTPTSAPEQPTTAPQPSGNITVYFTDNADFGTPNIHYWGDGETTWPGNAMTFSETNDFGQNVYKATIPANVTGIIFNGNNKQTVDITSGIANNVQWYTDGTENGKYKVVAIQHESTEPVQPTSAPVTPTSAPVSLPNHFYVDLTAAWSAVQGNFWYAWTWNEGEEGQWRQIEKFGYVAAASKVLFANFNSDTPSWDTCLAQTVDFDVENGGHLTILNEKENDKFKGTWATVEPTSAPVTPTSAPEQPTTAPQPGAAGYYLVGDMTNWAINGYKLTKNDGAALDEYMITATLAANDGIKVVYSEDGTTITTWFPDGMDNDYKITAAGTYDIYFRPNYDGTEDWASGCLYVAASETPVQPTTAPVQPTEAPEQPTTAPVQPTSSSSEITIKFTDALGWGQIGVYYWNGEDDYLSDNGWPGDEMAKAEINEYGQQVYTATIPRNPDGLIFTEYYGDRQTIDITDGIVDGAQWYSIDELIDGAYNVGYVAPVQPTTAPVQPTEAPEQPTTAPVQPTSSSSEITIKFTDALGWGQIGVYYWNGEDDYLSDNGWPGDEMAKAEINEYGQQVYTATIPRNPDGLIFTEYYGNRQTIDITDGIVDGAQWYSIDELIDGAYNVGYVAPVQPTTAPVQPTEAPEQPTTAPQPSGNITVYFTDNADFGTPNIYYWEGGADWPGTAMTYSETNDFGQNVYKATIPANVTGIIFNGNGKQTVDITTGITDYIQWYTTDTQDGKYAVASYQRPIPAQPTEAPVQPTDPPVQPTEAPQPVEGPVITTQPANWEGTDGQTATFTVVAEGDGLSYQWFYRSAGKVNWVAVAGGTTDTYSIAMSKARNGREVYVKVTDANGNSIDSEIVTMAYGVPVGPVITTQPADWHGQNGSNAVFTVVAEGDGLTYQWFYKRAGMAKFAVAQGETNSYYMVPMSAKNDGRTVFCVVTDQDGNSVNSNEATMSYPSITITQQPQNWFGQDGDQVSISVTAEGEGLSYQWFYYKPEKAKWIAAADTDAVYDSITMSPKFDNRQVYCQITNAGGFSVNSDIATITYSATPITITAQPQNWYGQDGAQVSISVTAEGEGLTYQWFYWKAEKNKWIAAADTDSVYDSITMASKFAGREVFCKITDQNGNTINSDSATINYPIGG